MFRNSVVGDDTYNTYPNPDDTNPTTLDRVNVGEAPVTVRSNDGRDELSKAERAEQGSRGTLHEEEAVRTGDEDEGLRDDSNLEVDNGVELGVVVVASSSRSTVSEGDTELAPEEVGTDANSDEGNTTKTSQIEGLTYR